MQMIPRFLPSQRLFFGGSSKGKAFFSTGKSSHIGSPRRSIFPKFSNPFADDYPKFIWEGLKNSRKDKDSLAPLFHLFNATQIYPLILKSNWSYFTFVVGGGCIGSWLWSEGWNSIWRSVNKGKLYNDCPYVNVLDED